jgi:hypothetical protein
MNGARHGGGGDGGGGGGGDVVVMMIMMAMYLTAKADRDINLRIVCVASYSSILSATVPAA